MSAVILNIQKLDTLPPFEYQTTPLFGSPLYVNGCYSNGNFTLNQNIFPPLCRCGTGLMEIVFEPDLFDGEEAAALIKELILILQVLHTSTLKNIQPWWLGGSASAS